MNFLVLLIAHPILEHELQLDKILFVAITKPSFATVMSKIMSVHAGHGFFGEA